MSYYTERKAAKLAGHAFYLPDNECANGHLAVHRVKDGQCTSCLYDTKQSDKLEGISIALRKDEQFKSMRGVAA